MIPRRFILTVVQALFLTKALNRNYLDRSYQCHSSVRFTTTNVIKIQDVFLIENSLFNQVDTFYHAGRQKHVTSKIISKDKNATVVLGYTWSKLSNFACDYSRISILWKVNPLMRNVPKWSDTL